MTDYPEHEKLKAIADKSQAIYDFLEWTDEMYDAYLRDHDGFTPNPSLRELLAEFFDIDLVKIEEEKDQMLADLRAANHG